MEKDPTISSKHIFKENVFTVSLLTRLILKPFLTALVRVFNFTVMKGAHTILKQIIQDMGRFKNPTCPKYAWFPLWSGSKIQSCHVKPLVPKTPPRLNNLRCLIFSSLISSHNALLCCWFFSEFCRILWEHPDKQGHDWTGTIPTQRGTYSGHDNPI